MKVFPEYLLSPKKPAMKILYYSAILLAFYSCDTTQQKTYEPLKLKGSESMHETFDALASDFEKLQDTLKITIEGGGSRTGLMAIKESTADMGLSSFGFDLNQELGAGHQIVDKVIANDGIVIVNNESNPIDKLTDEQISAIYNGKVKDWRELGGAPGLIQPIARDSNSGTQQFFEDYFKIEGLAATTLVARENHEIVNSVYENKNSIGFIGYAYFNMLVREVSISSQQDSVQFISPTPGNLENGTYPLKRSLHIYYRDNNDPRIRAFLRYLRTTRARQIIEGSGLIPADMNI